ncbi:MAG: signal peptide peptidase SppA [Verrucomicrobiales bacterium]
MKNKVLGCLGIVLVVVLFFSVMVNLYLLAKNAPMDLTMLGSDAIRPPQFRVMQIEPAKTASTRHRIAQIDLTGIITGDAMGLDSMVTATKRALKQAVDDARVKAIVIRIDSPGGEVTASDTIYHAVKEAQAKKPVIVFMDTVAASGGYYIACGAGKIIAHPLSITGSIGVIMQGIGYHALFGKVGLEMRTFKSGPMKDAGSGARPMTPEEQERFQNLVYQNYDRFVQIVAAARSLPVDDLKKGLADGRIYLGEEAKASKLVDETGYIERAYEVARNMAGIADAEVVRYERQPRLFDFLSLLGKAQSATASTKIELDVSGRLLPHLKPGTCYYLMPSWVE